jgi:hypothetical protein
MLLAPFAPPTTKTPLAFDASAGFGQASVTSISDTHVIGPNANLLLAFVTTYTQASPSSITVAGNGMTSMGIVNNSNSAGNGGIQVFRYDLTPGVLAGSRTVAATFSANNTSILTTMTFNGVTSVGTLQSVFGTSASLSQTVTATQQGIVAQGFSGFALFGGQASLSSYSGVNSVYNQGFGSMIAQAAGWASASANLTATAGYPSSMNWAGAGIFLS